MLGVSPPGLILSVTKVALLIAVMGSVTASLLLILSSYIETYEILLFSPTLDACVETTVNALVAMGIILNIRDDKRSVTNSKIAAYGLASIAFLVRSLDILLAWRGLFFASFVCGVLSLSLFLLARRCHDTPARNDIIPIVLLASGTIQFQHIFSRLTLGIKYSFWSNPQNPAADILHSHFYSLIILTYSIANILWCVYSCRSTIALSGIYFTIASLSKIYIGYTKWFHKQVKVTHWISLGLLSLTFTASFAFSEQSHNFLLSFSHNLKMFFLRCRSSARKAARKQLATRGQKIVSGFF